MKRILAVKQQIGTLSKNKKNPFFKSQYLDLNDLLEHIEPLLWEQGLVLLQPIQGGKVFSEIVECETNKVLISSSIDLPSITDPQKLGSAITYFRRYTLKSLLAISEEDDDGNKASKPEVIKKPELIIYSKPFHGGASKGTSLDEMRKYFTISDKVADEYLAAVNTYIDNFSNENEHGNN
jgi:hypothetical protein